MGKFKFPTNLEIIIIQEKKIQLNVVIMTKLKEYNVHIIN